MVCSFGIHKESVKWTEKMILSALFFSSYIDTSNPPAHVLPVGHYRRCHMCFRIIKFNSGWALHHLCVWIIKTFTVSLPPPTTWNEMLKKTRIKNWSVVGVDKIKFENCRWEGEIESTKKSQSPLDLCRWTRAENLRSLKNLRSDHDSNIFPKLCSSPHNNTNFSFWTPQILPLENVRKIFETWKFYLGLQTWCCGFVGWEMWSDNARLAW